MGAGQSRKSETKKRKVKITKTLLFSGQSCAGKSSLLNSIRWINGSEVFKDPDIWFERQSDIACQILTDMDTTLRYNRDWITDSPHHSEQRENRDEDIKMSFYYGTHSLGLGERRIALGALRDLWYQWSNIEEIWDRHWQRYFVNPHSLWFLRRIYNLMETDVEEYLSSLEHEESRQKQYPFELFVRSYKAGHGDIEIENIDHQSFIVSRAHIADLVMNHWLRTDKKMKKEMHIYPEIRGLIADFFSLYDDKSEDTGYLISDAIGHRYQWVDLPNGSSFQRQWLRQVDSADVFIHVASLISFAMIPPDHIIANRILDADLKAFQKLIVGSFENTKIKKQSTTITRKKKSKCILVFTNQDTLDTIIRSDIVPISSVPDYEGPQLDDDHPGYTIPQWIDHCVNNVINHIISMYRTLDGFDDFVQKVIILNPIKPNQVADKFLTKEVFQIIDD